MKPAIIIACVCALALGMTGCKNPKSKEKTLDWPAVSQVLSSYHDNGNGTVTDPNGLVWMKCAYGQTWDPNLNNCALTGSGTTYGAKSVQYCTIDGGCSDLTTLEATSGPAYDACHTLILAGLTWRLPTKTELGIIGHGMDRNTLLMIFPQTPDDKWFWSSTQDTSDAKLARAISVAGTDFGTDYGATKTGVYYVKCVH